MTRARPPGKGLLAALAVAVVVMGLGRPAHAQITFDPDGAAGANGDRTILALDWLPGNAVGLDSVPLTTGLQFTGLYQAKLGATTGNTTSIIGLNTAFELTVVSRFEEVVNNVNIVTVGGNPILATALFTSQPNQTTSFLEIYYDDLTDGIGVAANDLTGAGFTDGLRILAGTIIPGNFGDSNFTSQFTNIQLLDQAGIDNRGGQLTVSGSGAALITTTVNSYNTAFFKTPGITLVRTEFNSSLVDPFRQVDPSIAFFLGDPRVVIPVLGAINGVDDATPGQDFLFQADANQSFITRPAVVPEPGTMILAVTGLATVSLGSLRKLRRRPRVPAA